VRPAGLVAVLTTVTSIPVVVGGGSAVDASAGAAESTTISLVVFGEAEELAAYRTLADSFEAAQDAVDVELIEVADRQALIARVTTSIAAGDPPDLFLMNYRFFGQFAARGVLEPMQGRLDRSTVLSEDEMYDLALDAFRYQDDDLTCLPQNVSSLVVYFNLDLFAAAEVAVPSAGWTWDDMTVAAAALTRDEQHGLGVEPSIIRLAPFVWSNGGDIVDDQERPTRLTLDTPQALEALDRFLALGTAGLIPTVEESAAEDDESRFANGRLAMYLGSRRVTPNFRLITGFEWDVAPLPVLREPAGVLHSDAYCMTADSENHDAAFAFVEYALGPVGAPVIARTGRTVPSLRSVAQSDAFLAPDLPPASSSVFLDTIPATRALPTISTWPEIEDVTGEILEAARANGTPAAEVAEQLDRATRDIFARAE
jgi:multiple sugar transport system substrate-binding protein